MELDQVHCLIEPNYMAKLQDYILETECFFHGEDPISAKTIPDDEILDNENQERLLQIETELMDFASISQHSVSGSPGSSLEKELSPGMVKATEEKVLNEAQGELIEETSITDLLMMGAEAVEARNHVLSSAIIAKLNNLLSEGENCDNPFHRLALFFTQGLFYKSIDAPDKFQEPVAKQEDILATFQVLQELSPYVKFAHFTANQAILEATEGDAEIHVIDFNIMDGIQWPPLMVDLASRKNVVSLRVTAIITDWETSVNVQQAGRRLKEFAESIHFQFTFDQMPMMTDKYFQSLEAGHTLIANCMMHQLHIPKRSRLLVKTFIDGVTKLSPKILILVEEELFNFTRTPSMSFVEFFCEAVHHYTALSDSLVSSFCKNSEAGLRQIEKVFLGIRILDTLSQFPSSDEEKMQWGKGYDCLREFKPITMSFCNISQAKFLASLFRGGYWVQNEKWKLTLCWKSRPLTTVSIWVPISTSR